MFSRHIFLEIDWFCTDQTSFFNIFLTEVINNIALSTTIRSRNEPVAKPLTSQLVPKFWQHNLRLVVSGRCLHDSVTKFQDKFASLLQVNSLNSWDKFHKCYTDMYLIRFLPNFCSILCVFVNLQDFGDLPEFRGSVTARNIRSPVLAMTDSLLSEVYNNLYSVLTFISTQRP